MFFYKIHVFFERFYIPPDESGIIFGLTNFGLRFWAVTSTPKTSNKGLLSLSNASRDFDVISQMASVLRTHFLHHCIVHRSISK